MDIDVVVVGNGWEPTGLPAGVRGLGLPENLGIPAGRNAGVPLVDGGDLFFLDDDACLPDPDVLLAMAERFRNRPGARADPAAGGRSRRPARAAPLDPADPGRRSRPEQSRPCRSGRARWRSGGKRSSTPKGWPGRFWYAHEGIELAWRVWDGGWHVRYDGRIEVHHPAIQPTRHAEFYRFQARNRVWLARRNLPLPVGIAYVLNWMIVGGLRLRGEDGVRRRPCAATGSG